MANNIFGGNMRPAVPVAPMVSNTNSIGANGPLLNGLGSTQINSTHSNQSGPQCNVIYVNGMQEVLDYPKSPNEHFYFPENDSNVIWVRETDSEAHIVNPLRKLNYTMEEVPFGPEANFVTKQEHQQLYDLVSEVSKNVDRLIRELGGADK